MCTLSADAEHIELRELIEAARKEPVTVLENGERLPLCCLRPSSTGWTSQSHPSRGKDAATPDDRCHPS
jgi:hypothetical protein